jgi:hypothetical protein
MNHNAKDMTGLKFGTLTVVRLGTREGRPGLIWECQCECGEKALVRGSRLRSGHTKSCGCRISGVLRARNMSHGLSKTPEYRVWAGMIRRCHNQNEACYPRYGGKGIEVCGAWRSDFMAFLAHIGPRPSKAHSIDRIDNSLGYQPGNVRWATAEQQSRNRECIQMHEIDGITATLPELAQAYGIPVEEVRKRLWRKWSLERALKQPLRKSPSASRASPLGQAAINRAA